MLACCSGKGLSIPPQSAGVAVTSDHEGLTSPPIDVSAVTTIFNNPSLNQSLLSLAKSFGGFLDKAAVKQVVDRIGQVTLGVPFVGVGVQALALIMTNIVAIAENDKKGQDILKHADFIKEHLQEVDSTEHQEMLEETIICLLQDAWLLEQRNKEIRKGYAKRIWTYIKEFTCAQSIASTLQNVARELQYIQANLNTILLVQANRRQLHFSKMPPTFDFIMHKAGLETQIQHIMNFLEQLPTENKLRAVGVYGIGGIGKSTLLYGLREHILREKKDFVVASELLSESSDVKLVQQTLYKQLTQTSLEFHDFREGQGHLGIALGSLKTKKKKVCLILDNLQPSRMEIIQNILPDPKTIGECVTFLIVSARAKHVVESVCTSFAHENNIKFHEPSLLNETTAKKLFCEKAEMDIASQNDNEKELTRRIVPLLGGLPLAVEVYGSFFRDKKKREPEEWMKVLSKLEKATDWKLSDEQKVFQKIENSLELYDKSDQITLIDFMDAALYWRGQPWQDAKYALLWENDDDGLKNLAEKSLVSDPSKYGDNLHMHDILVNVATNKAEACQHIYKRFTEDDNPSSREGQEEHIRGLRCRGVPVSTTWLCKMKCLRFLHIAGGHMEMPTSTLVPQQSKGFSNWLLFILLFYFSLLIPILVSFKVTLYSFLLLLLFPALVVILIYSRIIPFTAKRKGIMPLLPNSLTFLTIDDCYDTISLADSIGSLTQLRSLTLTKLHGFHSELPPPHFSNLAKLQMLNLSRCVALAKLPNSFYKLASLRVLKLSACSLLTEIPCSIAELTKLESIDLSDCHSLSALPEAMGTSLTRLQSLRLSNCDALSALPQSFGSLSSLQILELSCSDKLARLPKSFGMLGALKQLDMSNCSGLKALPEDLGDLKSLQQLELSRCTSLTRIPPSISKLKNLRSLNLSRCTALEDVHPSYFVQLKPTLEHLDMSLCSGLKDVSQFSSVANLPPQNTWLFDSP